MKSEHNYEKIIIFIILLPILLGSFNIQKKAAKSRNTAIRNIENPYNPIPKMELLKSKNGKETTKMHFLVFGDSKTGKVWDKTVITDQQPKKKFLIAAHRGGYEHDFEDKAPENSIANIQNAIDHGFDIYECDVQRTSDGKFIIMHDPTIDRTTNGSGEVALMTSNEIRKYNLKYRNGKLSDEKIPFLADFISRGDAKIIFKIDYKPELKYLKDLIKEIDSLGLKDRVILRFKYKKETAEYIASLNQDELPSILFRVKKVKQYEELKRILHIKMISIFEKKNLLLKNYR